MSRQSAYNNRLSEAGSYLLMALGLVLPISIAASNAVGLLIFLLWIIKGDFRHDWEKLKNNPVVLSVTGFVLLHIAGLMWTTDIKNGIYVLKKESVLLLLPFFMLFARKEHINLYINTFLIAMMTSVILSFAVWFQVIPPFSGIIRSDPTPFMSHISYNPFLTIAIYIVLYRTLFEKNASGVTRILYAFLSLIMSIDMFITQGRAGQVMYFAMLSILMFQYFHRKIIWGAVFSMLSVIGVFSIFYNTSNSFQIRVDSVVRDIRNYENNRYTSTGERITWAINSFDIIKKHPVAGVGTGDFNVEYEKVKVLKSPEMPPATNPHNMYILVLTQFGMIGMISLAAILYTQVRQAGKARTHLQKHLGITLPLLFAVIMLGESYLRVYLTTMLFVYFSSFIYKDYEDDLRIALPVEKPRLPM